MYDAYRKQIEACDQELVKYLGDFEAKVDVVEKPLPKRGGPSRKRRAKRTGDYRFDVRQEAYRLWGVDVTRIPGLDGMALSLFSELGSNLTVKFPNSGEFSSWLGLCPDNDKTGGKVVWKEFARSTTGRGRCSAKRLALYIEVDPHWAICCAA